MMCRCRYTSKHGVVCVGVGCRLALGHGVGRTQKEARGGALGQTTAPATAKEWRGNQRARLPWYMVFVWVVPRADHKMLPLLHGHTSAVALVESNMPIAELVALPGFLHRGLTTTGSHLVLSSMQGLCGWFLRRRTVEFGVLAWSLDLGRAA